MVQWLNKGVEPGNWKTQVQSLTVPWTLSQLLSLSLSYLTGLLLGG